MNSAAEAEGAGELAGYGSSFSSVGQRREAVRVVVSYVATAAQLALLVALAYLPFAWWEHVKSNSKEIPSCANVYRVGRPIAPQPSDDRQGCLNEAGDVSFPFGKLYECENGSALLTNEYGWWNRENDIVKALTDRGTPPRAALDDCLGR